MIIFFDNLLGRGTAAAALLLLLTACSSGNNDAPADIAAPPADTPPMTASDAFEELYGQGIDRYLGVFAPMTTEQPATGVTTYTFDGSSGGPMCFTGNTFGMSTRDGTGSELMIFLQGGGVCSPNGCEAVEAAEPLVPPNFGILSALDASNPTSDFNVAYLPYCDGSLWMGDREVDSDGDGSSDRFFRGVQNLSASLDVIVRAYPAPSKILLTGNSAGGFGTHPALPLVRKLYPDVPIDLVNDSGVGISREGAQDILNDYWNAWHFYPGSCETCIGDDGNLTDYHRYQLAEDANMRMGFISTKRDAVVTVDSGSLDQDTFERELLAAIAELNEAYPNRFQSLIADGEGHTFLIRNFDQAIAGITVRQWMADMLSQSDNWISRSD
ncbi:MAG: pectin acetylesterase-family hydrolase [Pseudomonadota bacterium]